MLSYGYVIGKTNLNIMTQYTILTICKTQLQQNNKNHQNNIYKNIKKENVEQLSATTPNLCLNLKRIKELEKKLRHLLT